MFAMHGLHLFLSVFHVGHEPQIRRWIDSTNERARSPVAVQGLRALSCLPETAMGESRVAVF